MREVKEETGIADLEFIDGFREIEKYSFLYKGEDVSKTVSYLLAETKTKEVKLSFEHLDFKWLSYQEALKKLTFKNAQKIVQKAHDFILSKNL